MCVRVCVCVCVCVLSWRWTEWDWLAWLLQEATTLSHRMEQEWALKRHFWSRETHFWSTVVFTNRAQWCSGYRPPWFSTAPPSSMCRRASSSEWRLSCFAGEFLSPRLSVSLVHIRSHSAFIVIFLFGCKTRV